MSKSKFNRIKANSKYHIPQNFLQIKTIDMHTGGEPLRVIVDGFPTLNGKNVLEYRNDCKNRFDHLRKALMHEPRGHADMYGCILLPPNDENADFGIIFLHNEGYSTMCGHAIIAITKLAVEMEWVEKSEKVTKVYIDAPCGRIKSFARMENGKVKSVYFHCVPSFVLGLDLEINVPGIGNVQYDLAYGGAFYAYVDARKINLDLGKQNYSEIIKQGIAIKHAVMESPQSINHPFETDLSFLYGTIFIGDPINSKVDSRNVCVFAEGEVDRCPTGSGISGRMPIHYKRKEIKIGETMTVESITGSVFKGSVVREEKFGSFDAVIPEVEGDAFITGEHCFLIDPDDPFKEGFFLR